MHCVGRADSDCAQTRDLSWRGIARSGEVKSGGGASSADQSRLSSGLAELALEDGGGSAKTLRGPSGNDAYHASILNSARKVSGGNQ